MSNYFHRVRPQLPLSSEFVDSAGSVCSVDWNFLEQRFAAPPLEVGSVRGGIKVSARGRANSSLVRLRI